MGHYLDVLYYVKKKTHIHNGIIIISSIYIANPSFTPKASKPRIVIIINNLIYTPSSRIGNVVEKEYKDMFVVGWDKTTKGR